MKFPQQATAIIIEALVQYRHAEIGPILMRAGIGDTDPGQERRGISYNKNRRVEMAIKDAPDEVRESALRKLVLYICNSSASTEVSPEWLVELVEVLRSGGIALHADVNEERINHWSPPRTRRTWRLGPMGAQELPATKQAGQLESLLAKHGLGIAARHYAQAFANFTAGNLESSNGQLRAALEDTLVTLTRRRTAWTGDGGGSAIDALNGKKYFQEGEHDFFKGLWKISHGEGSHPGLTTDAEAEFRFSAITSAMYFLLHRLTDVGRS